MSKNTCERDVLRPLLVDKLLANGWKEFSATSRGCRHFQKRIDDIPLYNARTLCKCNDKLHVNFNMWDVDLGKTEYFSYEVEVTEDELRYDVEMTQEGNHADWFNLKAYSLSIDDAMKRLDIIIFRMVLAWEALQVTDEEVELELVANKLKA